MLKQIFLNVNEWNHAITDALVPIYHLVRVAHFNFVRYVQIFRLFEYR